MNKPTKTLIVTGALLLFSGLASAQEMMPPGPAPQGQVQGAPGPLGVGQQGERGRSQSVLPGRLERGTVTASHLMNEIVRPIGVDEGVWAEGLSPAERRQVAENARQYEKAKRAVHRAQRTTRKYATHSRSAQEKLQRLQTQATTANKEVERAARQVEKLSQNSKATSDGEAQYQAARQRMRKLRGRLDQGTLTAAQAKEWEAAKNAWLAALEKRRQGLSAKKRQAEKARRLPAAQADLKQAQDRARQAKQESVAQQAQTEKRSQRYQKALQVQAQAEQVQTQAQKRWKQTLELIEKRRKALARYEKAKRRFNSEEKSVESTRRELREAVREYNGLDTDIKSRRQASRGMSKVISIAGIMSSWTGYKSGVTIDATGALTVGKMAIDLAEATLLPKVESLNKDGEGYYSLDDTLHSRLYLFAESANLVRRKMLELRVVWVGYRDTKAELGKASKVWNEATALKVPAR